MLGAPGEDSEMKFKLHPYQEQFIKEFIDSSEVSSIFELPYGIGKGLSRDTPHRENVRKLLTVPKVKRASEFSSVFSAAYNGRPPRKTIMQHAVQSALTYWKDET